MIAIWFAVLMAVPFLSYAEMMHPVGVSNSAFAVTEVQDQTWNQTNMATDTTHASSQKMEWDREGVYDSDHDGSLTDESWWTAYFTSALSPYQLRVSGTCSTGYHMMSINADGTVNCVADSTSSVNSSSNVDWTGAHDFTGTTEDSHGPATFANSDGQTIGTRELRLKDTVSGLTGGAFQWKDSLGNVHTIDDSVTLPTASGQIKIYDSVTGQWVPRTLTGDATIDSSGNVSLGTSYQSVTASAGNITLTGLIPIRTVLMTATGTVGLPDCSSSTIGSQKEIIQRMADGTVSFILAGDADNDHFELDDGTTIASTNYASLSNAINNRVKARCLQENIWLLLADKGTLSDGGAIYTPPAYVHESFNQTGVYDLSSHWSTTGLHIDPDLIPGLDGTAQALFLDGITAAATISANLSLDASYSEIWVKFIVKQTSTTEGSIALVRIYNGATQLGQLTWQSTGGIKTYYGTATNVTGSTDPSNNTEIAIWWHWKCQTAAGNDGVSEIYLDTSSPFTTMPGTADASVSTGNSLTSAAVANLIKFYADNDTQIVIDEVKYGPSQFDN